MKAIEIKNLTKKYKNILAVDDLTLNIKEGEFFALLGQNGAGKTTTIKMLSGLITPTLGDAILLGDSIITNLQGVKQKVNVSPQETAVAPNLSVRENLEFIAAIYGLKGKEIKKAADIKIQQFNLSDKEKAKAKTLSGGLARRLSIAMALISNPKIIFLDEPTLGLDVRARRDLWQHLLELKGKVTIILTTHYLEEAEELADRIAIMEKGKIQIVGTMEELKQQTGKEKLEDIFLSLTEEEVEQ